MDLNDHKKCSRCGDVAAIGRSKCQRCLGIHARNSVKLKQSRRLAGVCVDCGDNLDRPKGQCSKCFEKYYLRPRLKLKMDVYNAYGGPKCSCDKCGEYRVKFLTIDHVKGGGTQHRSRMTSNNIYTWLKKNEYPSGFQVLCWNCNCGRSLNNGACPHEESS